jgi:hypothetical protein
LDQAEVELHQSTEFGFDLLALPLVHQVVSFEAQCQARHDDKQGR